MPAVGPLIAIAAGLVSLAVTWLIYRNAGRLGVVQDPNARSSHVRPTPSGGGLGIVAGGSLAASVAIWSLPGPAFVVAVLSLFVAAKLFRWEADEKLPLKRKAWAAAVVAIFIGAAMFAKR